MSEIVDPCSPYIPEPNDDGTGVPSPFGMSTPDKALAYLERQRTSGSTAWAALCEKLCRSSYGLGPHFSSANLHANAIPTGRRYGRETPSKGDLVMYKNSTYGHIVVATGKGWECYTNDYGGRGKVVKADARNLASWCGATSWWVADAWWSARDNLRTHNQEDDMALTPEDIEKVAREVWRYKNPDITDEQAYAFLRRIDVKVSSVSGGPGGSLSDADVLRIANKTADILSARLKS